MDEKQIVQLVAALREKGITFEKGLNNEQVKHIESVGTFQFPPDLREFLQYAVPISYTLQRWDGETTVYDHFPNWHHEPEAILQHHKNQIFDSFCFDVEHNQFWMKEWEIRPEKLKDAFEIVKLALEKAPPLIPLCGHRYLPAYPVMAGNPVLSMVQAIDTIYYGYNLENYFQNEFLRSGELVYGSPSDYRQIPFWSEIVC
ncbi:hypothetical protein G4Y79_18800 [Phototrophicus methaneseepsis]|uniref:SMI1/KNR4 family protein n=1 Tax=Phototrophicus methaneseepsis TaxID=2710758 RepID=A0A7S8IDN6_9CHLR|nr:hypothetical protein [Phototrophicus methaneseepsis]QPC81721.1 hypothetical protein G4Y79_18800 [Phototrophicus methaneseepsis]